ncbi:MAG: PAS domain-containing protein [Bacteroidetes bacterium]|nr:PAS domain-containing protein [Bacteroidota bacterium]MBU2585298.1 PAS domain-containing protein [Bacteroidota bacterium]
MKPKLNLTKKSHLILLISLVSLLIAIAGYYYYLREENTIRRQKYTQLKAIADLKEAQLVRWHKERLSDAYLFTSNKFFIKRVELWLQNKNDKTLTEELKERLSIPRRLFSYKSVFLATKRGKLLLAVGSNLTHFDSVTSQKIIKNIKDQKASFSGLFFCELENKIHYDIIAPFVNDKKETLAAIVFRTIPNEFLYPTIQTWPTPSQSSETVMLRVEKDSILFLNELRHFKNTALKLKISRTQTKVPAVQAALGKTGMFEGIDYRGVKVLSDIRVIPETDWIMINKVDRKEIYADLYTKAFVIIGFGILLIIIVGLGFVWIYNNRQRTIYKELYNKEKELWQNQEKFNVTMDSLGEGVITVNLDAKVQYMNRVAEDLTEWNFREARGRNLNEVYPVKNEETGQRENNILDKVIKHGIIKELANHTILITKSGKEIPVLDTGTPIRYTDGSIIGIVIVFQDEMEKRSQKRLLKENEQRLKKAQQVAHLGFLDWNLKTNEIFCSDEVYHLYGIEKSDQPLRLEEISKGVHPDDWEYVQKNLELAMRGEKEYNIDHRIQRPNGEIIWVHAQAQLVYDADGKPKTLLGTILDITERKQVAENLRKKDEHHRAVIENIFKFVPEGLLVFTKNLSPMKQNKAFEEIVQKYAERLSYTEEELAEKIIEQLRGKILAGDTTEIHITKKNQFSG